MFGAGIIQVGYDGAMTTAQQNKLLSQVLQNDQEGNCLILENRYSGPMGVAQCNPTLFGGVAENVGPFMNVPPLSKLVLPWPRDAYALVNVQNITFYANAMFHGANTPLVNQKYQLSTVRYWFTDSDNPVASIAPLYPFGQRSSVSLLRSPITQGANRIDHTVTNFTPVMVGGTVLPIFDNTDLISPDTRILRIILVVMGGTGQLNNLDLTLWTEISNGGGSFSGVSHRPFGSTNVNTSYPGYADIDTGGIVGVGYDMDAGAAGVTAIISARYELGLPILD